MYETDVDFEEAYEACRNPMDMDRECDKFEPQENLGALEKLTNQIWCKNQQKPLIEKQFTHTNVNRTMLFFYV